VIGRCGIVLHLQRLEPLRTLTSGKGLAFVAMEQDKELGKVFWALCFQGFLGLVLRL
jgi:hypothetical protein